MCRCDPLCSRKGHLDGSGGNPSSRFVKSRVGAQRSLPPKSKYHSNICFSAPHLSLLYVCVCVCVSISISLSNRWQWLHQRLPHWQTAARCQALRDRRGHKRDPAYAHRQRAQQALWHQGMNEWIKHTPPPPQHWTQQSFLDDYPFFSILDTLAIIT